MEKEWEIRITGSGRLVDIQYSLEDILSQIMIARELGAREAENWYEDKTLQVTLKEQEEQ